MTVAIPMTRSAIVVNTVVGPHSVPLMRFMSIAPAMAAVKTDGFIRFSYMSRLVDDP